MREVDEALVRLFARERDRAQASVPHSPHFPIPRENPDIPTKIKILQFEWPPIVLSMEHVHGARFERMADALLKARDSKNLKVLLFTSCRRAEGRTTLVLTLARALSRKAGRTLLVDADLAAPTLARRLGLNVEVGLDDVVDQGQSLDKAFVQAPDKALTLLPLRAPIVHSRRFLTNPAWRVILARLRRDFDLVLLDGSPLFVGMSTALLHRAVDAAVLVHNHTLTGERELVRAQEILHGSGIPVLGVAETFANIK